ncbi:MAG: hypothetical protein JSR36_05790 [Proteobacteria bacterium]|nr:hypothetical protein [Pseudomonadota bacterium]
MRAIRPTTLCSAWLLLMACQGAQAEESVTQASWVPRELHFTYQGFTAKYSCDGLSDRIKEVLLLLGARKQDLQVSPIGCSGGYGRPTPFPGVSAKMSVLEPIGPKTPAGAAPVAVAWRNVDVSRPQSLAAAGDCELTEQIKQSILPLFTVRNVEYNSTCVPHQLTPGGTSLKADVLVPAPAPAPSAG